MSIHKQCIKELQSVILIQYPFSCHNTTEEDKSLIQSVLSLENNNPDELIKFADILTKNTKYGNGILRLSLINKLSKIFAVDGLVEQEEFNYKYYVKNLRYGFDVDSDMFNIHVNAVRHLYVKFKKLYLTPDLIRDAIINFYKGNENDELAIEYGKFIKDCMINFLELKKI